MLFTNVMLYFLHFCYLLINYYKLCEFILTRNEPIF